MTTMSENEDTETDACKLFIGGLSWETNEEKLQDYFSEYGEVIHSMIMINRDTGKSRGFGFVTFKDPESVKRVLSIPQHSIDNRVIDPKVCTVKNSKARKPEVDGKNSEEFGKIFLGGLPADITETSLKEFFSQYGRVTEAIIMYDQEKKRPRGFGFLTFDSDEPVNKLVANRYIAIRGKQVEIKKASPQSKPVSNNNYGPRGGYGYGNGDQNNQPPNGYNNGYRPNDQQGQNSQHPGPNNAQYPPQVYGYPMWNPWTPMPAMNGMPPQPNAPGGWQAPPPPAQPAPQPMAWPGYSYPPPWSCPPPGMYGIPPTQTPQQQPPPQSGPPQQQPPTQQQPPQVPPQPGQPPMQPNYVPAQPYIPYGQTQPPMPTTVLPPTQPTHPAPVPPPQSVKLDHNDGYAPYNQVDNSVQSATPQNYLPNNQLSTNVSYGVSQDTNGYTKPSGNPDFHTNYYPATNGPRHSLDHLNEQQQQAQFGKRTTSSYHPYRRP